MYLIINKRETERERERERKRYRHTWIDTKRNRKIYEMYDIQKTTWGDVIVVCNSLHLPLHHVSSTYLFISDVCCNIDVTRCGKTYREIQRYRRCSRYRKT